jgi:hypothetical protein
MGTSENLDTIEGGGWGVFIASNHFLAVGWVCWRWAHRTVWWRTGHVLFIVRCAPHQHTYSGLDQVDHWSHCTGQSGDLWLRCSDFCRTLFITVHFCSRPLTCSDCCSAGLPDMSSAHRTVRWIKRSAPREFPRVPYSLACGPGVLDTVRCAKGSTLSCPLLQICLCPQLNFFLGLCWTLCTWDKWHLDKLVSPRGLWWTSTTKIEYMKWLGPFPFQSHLHHLWK